MFRAGLAAYSERFSLPFLAQVVVAAAERKRPGLGRWSQAAEAELKKTFDGELAELKRRFLELFDDHAYWAKVEETMQGVVFPRYAAEAKRFSELEQRDFGSWRGGDLVARLSYVLGGFALGVVLVKVPFIPIPETWDALIFALAIAAPFLPDAQAWFHRRRYAKRVNAILEDVKEAEAQLSLYPALAPVVDPVGGAQVPDPALGQPERVGKKGR